MSSDVCLFHRSVLADEVAAQRLGIFDCFLNRPTPGRVTGLDERVALAGENINEWVGLVLIGSRTVAVAVAIYNQSSIPFFGDVDAKLGAVDLADLGAHSSVKRREKREHKQQGFHGGFHYTTRTAAGPAASFGLALQRRQQRCLELTLLFGAELPPARRHVKHIDRFVRFRIDEHNLDARL